MFRSFNASTVPFEQPRHSDPRPLDDTRELIGRYPNLSEIELARLINVYRELSALDMALIISDSELAPKLGRFRKDHRQQLRTPFRQYAVLVYIAIAGIFFAVWAAMRGVM